MSFSIIGLIILILSFLGVGFIIFRKIPVLVQAPEIQSEEPAENLIPNLLKKIKELRIFKNFSAETFLQKFLARIRILALKIDSRIFNLLKKLREKTQKSKLENDTYWDEVKKPTDAKDSLK